jgi:putative transposase
MSGSRHLGAELLDELLNGKIFYSLKEVQIVVEQWRKHYNAVRLHSSMGYRPPAQQAFGPFPQPLDQGATMQ